MKYGTSRLYQDRPDYADYDSPHKFQAIQGIIARRLKEHPKAICSYSGGSDSDVLIDMIERTREIFHLPPVDYVFVNTGLEMAATKRHVQEVAEKYGVTIREERPKINIVMAAKKYGIPFVSKIMSKGIETMQRKNIPVSIGYEYEDAEDKAAKRKELAERYPRSASCINFICGCNKDGEPRPEIQLAMNSIKYMRDFYRDNPPDFQISAKCCDYCKKAVAHRVQKGYDLIITGERRDEGGLRSVPRSDNTSLCFTIQGDQYRLRPLYYVSDKDKKWYKSEYGLRYSDAYEIYGLKRTGCCGCPISYRAVADLDIIGEYEPQLKKAAWAIFGKSYLYRQMYDAYKAARKAEERRKKNELVARTEMD